MSFTQFLLWITRAEWRIVAAFNIVCVHFMVSAYGLQYFYKLSLKATLTCGFRSIFGQIPGDTPLPLSATNQPLIILQNKSLSRRFKNEGSQQKSGNHSKLCSSFISHLAYWFKVISKNFQVSPCFSVLCRSFKHVKHQDCHQRARKLNWTCVPFNAMSPFFLPSHFIQDDWWRWYLTVLFLVFS